MIDSQRCKSQLRFSDSAILQAVNTSTCQTPSLGLGSRYMCHGQKSRFVGDGHPTFNRNPYNGYINPYYWVDDHPLLYGNNGSLDFRPWHIYTLLGVPNFEASCWEFVLLYGYNYSCIFAPFPHQKSGSKNPHFMISLTILETKLKK